MLRFARPRRLALLLCAVAAPTTLLAGCGGGDDDLRDAKAEGDAIIQAAKEDARLIREEAVAEAAERAREANGAGSGSSSGGAAGTLPDLVGDALPEAQDAARAAGFSDITSHDASDADRRQVVDGNWKVCTQTPAAGAKDTAAEVDLGVVKRDEACPTG